MIEEIRKFKFDELFAGHALPLGRVTYQGFAAAWRSGTDKDGVADRMNSIPRYVVSTTLEKIEWNNSRRIRGNVAEEVSSLKQRTGKDILIAGSGALVHTLIQHDRIDEYRLLVYPVVLGNGKRFFEGLHGRLNLKPASARHFLQGSLLVFTSVTKILYTTLQGGFTHENARKVR